MADILMALDGSLLKDEFVRFCWDGGRKNPWAGRFLYTLEEDYEYTRDSEKVPYL
jgi:hypothetical protein